jgi:cytochrome oxidase Cu insertion factor (SCO1/SenC/PrrC family)
LVAAGFQVRRVPRRWVRHAGFAFLTVLNAATLASASTLLPPDAATTIGQRIPFDGFVDENGQPFSAQLPEEQRERDARPWIVSPMYTRCLGTCPAITASLRRALDQSRLAPAEYRVLSFSFDPNETNDGLHQFRIRMRLPADWLVLRAGDAQALERTLKSLDFRTITVGDGNFEHPNLVAVLAPDRRLVGYLFGVNFTAADLAGTVRRASAGVSAVDAWRPYVFAIAALGFLASGLLFVWLLSERRARAAVRGQSERVYPNCTERRVKDPNQNPVIGNVTAGESSMTAPAETMTGTKCSCVGSAMPTPGARTR